MKTLPSVLKCHFKPDSAATLIALAEVHLHAATAQFFAESIQPVILDRIGEYDQRIDDLQTEIEAARVHAADLAGEARRLQAEYDRSNNDPAAAAARMKANQARDGAAAVVGSLVQDVKELESKRDRWAVLLADLTAIKPPEPESIQALVTEENMSR